MFSFLNGCIKRLLPSNINYNCTDLATFNEDDMFFRQSFINSQFNSFILHISKEIVGNIYCDFFLRYIISITVYYFKNCDPGNIGELNGTVSRYFLGSDFSSYIFFCSKMHVSQQQFRILLSICRIVTIQRTHRSRPKLVY